MKRRNARRAASTPPPANPAAPAAGPAFALGAAILIAAALLLYWSALRHPLVFDDHHLTEYALKTRYAQAASWFGLRWFSDASFGWIYALSGKDMFFQRLAYVLLHAMAGAVLFGFLARLFGAVLEDPRSRWFAFVGAILFVVHPVAVYGVAYLMERSIVLATLFALLSLWAVLEGLLRRSPGWWIAAAVAYYLAVFSKEHAIMVPAVAAALVLLVVPARDRLDSFSSGLKLWDDAIRKNTDLSAPYVERAIVNRGIVHLQSRRLEAAGADFERALALNPRSPDAHLARSTLRLRSGCTGGIASACEILKRTRGAR